MQFSLTTWLGINPWAAWPKLAEVGKMFVPLILMSLLIDCREKLRLLLVVMAGSVALVAVKGGFWALITGFRDRVYGAPGSEMAGNNEFAIAVSMAIPLLLLWRDEVDDRALRAVLVATTVLCFGAALSSWSRGAFLSLGAMSLLLLWHYRHKSAALVLLAVGLVATGLLFPEGWIARMTGMSQYQSDESAMGRLEVWQSGWNYMLSRPWFGGGFESWIYVSLAKGSRDWHNAYIKMAVEHGFPGLLLWVVLLGGTFLSLIRMARLGKFCGLEWVRRWAAMLRASLTAYAVGAVFLGIAYWELLYWLLMASILATRFAIQEQRDLPRAQQFGHRTELASGERIA
jgi:probable O-glycosylation ligase (exosortase A-associated)